MHAASDESFIARAYLALSSAPKGEHGERAISLVRIRNYEIRMIETSQPGSINPPSTFWIELFDHNLRSTVDSCRCETVEDAADAYEALVSQANEQT